MSNVVSQATSMSTTAWWIAFAFTFTATVVFLALSYIRNVKPEARLVRCSAPPRVSAPRARDARRARPTGRRAAQRVMMLFPSFEGAVI